MKKKKWLEQTDYMTDTGYLLHCPVCSRDFTHHGDVTIYDRDVEDGPVKTTHIGDNSQPGECPSGRRGGV